MQINYRSESSEKWLRTRRLVLSTLYSSKYMLTSTEIVTHSFLLLVVQISVYIWGRER